MSESDSQTMPSEPIMPDVLAVAEKTLGLEFTSAERELMADEIGKNVDCYAQLRKVALPNDVPPALLFNPQPGTAASPARPRQPVQMGPVTLPALPADLENHLEEVAFFPVTHLAELIRTRRVRSQALTEMYLDRLKRYDPVLHCVVTLTEELALEQARRADAEIAAGNYRGPLHGIPWGAKDLLATRNIPTTWGAMPYKEQVIDRDATVVQRLADAGAVLVAKLTMGALAWGDYWFGGRTCSPWNLNEGSSGSSAGSGAATAAGLVGFAIGTETHGSIISPCTNCGLSGLRPTFGRVSRAGAMALSWSMDKIGPMGRTVEDCALVFNVIYGPDGADHAVVDRPFHWQPDMDLSNLRIGYVQADFAREYAARENDRQTLDVLRSLGANLLPIELPDLPVDAMRIILLAEAAAAFDELTRSGRDDLLVRQIQEAWPNRFRAARFIPAVEYIQANRVRTLAIQAMQQLMHEVDLFVAPAKEGDTLLLTNLTGHPAVVIPNGFGPNGLPTTVTLIGDLYDEATPLAVAKAYQDATDFHLQHPSLSI